MALFFTSDSHFGDHRVLNISRRPFGSVGEMDAAMLDRWNTLVTTDDDVWHLGDFARTAQRARELFPELNGRKHLIIGNNDPHETLRLDWASAQHYAEIDHGGVRLILCHYPFRTWNGIGRGAINLHGHSHGRLKPLTRQFDVGVDVHGFQPVRLESLMSRCKPRDLWPK